MKQYQELCRRVIEEGTWIENARTGKRCLTVINADLEYDMSDHRLPVLTTKKVAWKPAIAEFLGYLKGYSSAAQFRALGCNTWNANANGNESWLNNPHRRGPDDMGRCYGVQAREWMGPYGVYDQLELVYLDLLKGIDNRAEIMTFWNPGELHMACLKPCVHTHTFSLINGTLHLTSYQRSDDLPLGHAFNQVQLGMFLMLMAQITNNKAGTVYHKVVNAHIYEDQLPFLIEQLERVPRELPKLRISSMIKTLEDVSTWVSTDQFTLEGYNPHPAIKFPFSV